MCICVYKCSFREWEIQVTQTIYKQKHKEKVMASAAWNLLLLHTFTSYTLMVMHFVYYIYLQVRTRFCSVLFGSLRYMLLLSRALEIFDGAARKNKSNARTGKKWKKGRKKKREEKRNESECGREKLDRWKTRCVIWPERSLISLFSSLPRVVCSCFYKMLPSLRHGMH